MNAQIPASGKWQSRDESAAEPTVLHLGLILMTHRNIRQLEELPGISPGPVLGPGLTRGLGLST